MLKEINRREWLSAAALSGTHALGANDRIRAAVIGSGNRGKYLTGVFKELGVQMAGVCDVYEPHLAEGLKIASEGARPFDDYKRVLDDKSFDAVVIATPEHWHAQMAIDAANAGKDFYVEKPMAHSVNDAFRVVEAARRNQRVGQVGTQRRSWNLFQEARSITNSTDVGTVRLVNSWWLNTARPSLNGVQLKGKLDWEKWLGPAPKRPLDPVRFIGWEYFYDYHGGMLSAQGAHIVDEIQWFMNSSYPTVVNVTGGKVNVEGAEVPETACLSMEFPENYLAIFTVGYRAMKYPYFNDQLVQFHGNHGRLDVGRESYALFSEEPTNMDPKPSKIRREPGVFMKRATYMHVQNFMDCVKSRKDPNSPVETGRHTAVTLCMAIESLRKRRQVRWDMAAKRMI